MGPGGSGSRGRRGVSSSSTSLRVRVRQPPRPLRVGVQFGLNIPVQIGPEGLGAPFCSYRTASPRCPSYKLAEPNVHRGRFLLQNGSPS